MGENHFAPLPCAVYGAVLLLAAIAYWILQQTIIRAEGAHDVLRRAVGRDWKGKLSPVLYLTAIVASFYVTWLALAIYVGVALMWLVPDKRIERTHAQVER
jgi:uncharacterized membrane protein